MRPSATLPCTPSPPSCVCTPRYCCTMPRLANWPTKSCRSPSCQPNGPSSPCAAVSFSCRDSSSCCSCTGWLSSVRMPLKYSLWAANVRACSSPSTAPTVAEAASSTSASSSARIWRLRATATTSPACCCCDPCANTSRTVMLCFMGLSLVGGLALPPPRALPFAYAPSRPLLPRALLATFSAFYARSPRRGTRQPVSAHHTRQCGAAARTMAS